MQPLQPQGTGASGSLGDPSLPPAAAPLHGEKMVPLGAAHVQEWLLDRRVHGTQGINGTNYSFLCFHLRFSEGCCMWSDKCNLGTALP